MLNSKIKKKKTKRIVFSGGGSGGSVSPLIAIKNELEKEPASWEFIWIGTKTGIEQDIIQKEKRVKFKAITSGKWRRYFSWQNFTDPFKIFLGFIQSFFFLLFKRPKIVLSAGSFVSVPVAWAAYLLRIPILIHQQDVLAGLANKLMAPCARVITVTFVSSLKDYGKKARWVGNPVSPDLKRSNLDNYFQIKAGLPVILIVGGGTGAIALNDLVIANISQLTKLGQVIHVTGKGKVVLEAHSAYCAFEFLDHDLMLEALNRAQVVVSRAGLASLTELSYLAKPTILIPMPDTHQEDNAREFEKHEAALILNQKTLSGEEFIDSVKKVIKDRVLRNKLSRNIRKVMKPGANQEIVKIIQELIK